MRDREKEIELERDLERVGKRPSVGKGNVGRWRQHQLRQ